MTGLTATSSAGWLYLLYTHSKFFFFFFFLPSPLSLSSLHNIFSLSSHLYHPHPITTPSLTAHGTASMVRFHPKWFTARMSNYNACQSSRLLLEIREVLLLAICLALSWRIKGRHFYQWLSLCREVLIVRSFRGFYLCLVTGRLWCSLPPLLFWGGVCWRGLESVCGHPCLYMCCICESVWVVTVSTFVCVTTHAE